MKKLIIFYFCLFSIILFGQDSIGVKKQLYKLNFFAPGFAYEYGLAKNLTLRSEISLGFFYKYSSNVGSTTGFNANIDEQLRYYYNFERRTKKRKLTINNAANYFAISAAVSSRPFAGVNLNNYIFYNSVVTSILYGYNRNNGRFNHDFNFGLGIGFVEKKTPLFVPIIKYSFGLIIFDKKN